MSQPVFLSEETVKKYLDWELTYRAVSVALESVPKQRAIQNPRTFTKTTKNDSLLLTMPGYLDDDHFGALGCKFVTVASNNANLLPPLPTINANIALFDENTGLLEAIVAGTEITAWRTAAASAVATKNLTLEKNLKILAILGAGTQGKIHAIAFEHFFDFEEIRIWNRNSPKAQNLVSDLNKLYHCNKFKYFESNKDCVQFADIIVTATFSNKPIVELDWLKKGAHINAVGAGLNHHSELSESIYRSASIYVDYRSGADRELVGLKKLGVEFKGEIGEVITGDVSRPDSNEITVFQSLGMAAEDCAMARAVFDLYKKNLK